MTLNSHLNYIISTTCVQQFLVREKQQFFKKVSNSTSCSTQSSPPERTKMGAVDLLFSPEHLMILNVRVVFHKASLLNKSQQLRLVSDQRKQWSLPTWRKNDSVKLTERWYVFLNMLSLWEGFKGHINHMWFPLYVWTLGLITEKVWLPCMYAMC